MTSPSDCGGDGIGVFFFYAIAKSAQWHIDGMADTHKHLWRISSPQVSICCELGGFGEALAQFCREALLD